MEQSLAGPSEPGLSWRTYDAVKRQLVGIAVELSSLAEEYGQTIRDALGDAQRRLKEDVFNLVVLGQFKRGKSTLVNALLGEEVLPTAVIPLTSLVTILDHAADPHALVLYLDGRKENIPLVQLAEFVTERANPANRKHVEEVRVFHPAEFLEQARLIDTPGVGSVYLHNTRVAYDFLPQADAAIFVVTADPPISEEELSFLRAVREHVAKVFFVQNKIDILNSDELQESLQFTSQVIEQALSSGSPVTVYALSARKALEAKREHNSQLLAEAGWTRLESDLEDFLVREKGYVLLRAMVARLHRLAYEVRTALNLELRAHEMPQVRLDESRRLFNQRLETIDAERRDLVAAMETERKRLVRDVLDAALEHGDHRIEGLHEQLDQRMKAGAALETIESFITDGVAQLFAQWMQELERRLQDELEQGYARFRDRATALVDAILRAAAELFELPIPQLPAFPSLQAESRFRLRTHEEPVLLQAVTQAGVRIMPGRLGRRLREKEAQQRLQELFDRHCGQMRYDLVQRLQATELGFRRQLLEGLDAATQVTRGAIERAAADRDVKADTADTRRQALRGRLDRLLGVEQILGRLGEQLRKPGPTTSV
jgi:GTPase Era involved in 16S rRNA processing